jgi:hypothetical protein
MACEVPPAAFLKPVLAAPSASLTALAEPGVFARYCRILNLGAVAAPGEE